MMEKEAGNFLKEHIAVSFLIAVDIPTMKRTSWNHYSDTFLYLSVRRHWTNFFRNKFGCIHTNAMLAAMIRLSLGLNKLY